MTETAVIRFAYTLEEKEMLRYYQFALQNNPETAKSRMHVATWIPMGLLIFLIVFKAAWYWWITAAIVSILWIFMFSQMIFDDVSRTSALRKFKTDKPLLKEIEVEDSQNELRVNGIQKNIVGYCAYLDLLVIQMDDNSNLIVPERVFGSDAENMKQFITDIAHIGSKTISK